MRTGWIWLATLLAVVALIGLAQVTQAGSGETRLEVRLDATAADPLASGTAKFEMRDDRTRLSVEVQDVASSGPLDVKVNGSSVGSITLVAGGGDLNLDSRDGDTVPSLSSGALVEVFDAGGTKILSGTLVPK